MITRETIADLHHRKEELNISIYIPTHRSEPEAQQDRIRFKNVLSTVEEKLKERNVSQEDRDHLLDKARELLESPEFWRYNDQGLAVFINRTMMEYYRLPYKVEEDHHVSDLFLITPLLRMISLEGSYFVLALSQKDVRLLKCTRDEVERISLEQAPTSMEEFRRFDVYQKSVQQHSGQGKGTPIFHGHGGGDEHNKVVIEYLKSIENEVTSRLKKRNDPLIIAGVDNAVSHYRKINHYQRLTDEGIISNPDPMSDKELKDEGWERIKSIFLQDMYADIERLGDLSKSGKVSDDVSEIVKGAYYGKIDALFLQKSLRKWGAFNPDIQASTEPEHTGEERDLINLAALFTLEKGGDVYAFGDSEVPIKSEIAAIYRYS